MPTVALHSHYWQTQTPEPPIVAGGSADGGYPNVWQPLIVGCLALVFVLWPGL